MPFHANFASRRSPVMGRGGMVATSQPLAVAAGLEILARGGNAADAAVATAAALNVAEPTSTGIGGDYFALFYDAKTGQIPLASVIFSCYNAHNSNVLASSTHLGDKFIACEKYPIF